MSDPVSITQPAAWKARRLYPDGIEALSIAVDEKGLWAIFVNTGIGDDLLCDGMTENEAIGVAHALDAVFDCGVYNDDGARL